MELSEPFTGWHYDENGTLHTPCGYRCTPEQIEHALWLKGMLQFETIGKHVIYADSPQIEPRKVYDWRDFDKDRHITACRSTETEPCTKNPDEAMPRLILRSSPR